MMTIPVFMLAKKVNVRSERVRKALANLTVCGFGVYDTLLLYRSVSGIGKNTQYTYSFTDTDSCDSRFSGVLVDCKLGESYR